VKSFHDIDYKEEFDGVWASASLLHCHRQQLRGIIVLILESLKEKSVAYMSFKYGEASLVDGRGRQFTNLTTQSLRELLTDLVNAEILEIWDSEMLLRGQPQKWTHAIIRKIGEQL
jgi:hypothetical protein